MATTKAQRLGILIIMIVTVIGTLGSFAVMILATNSDSQDAARKQKLQSDYQASYNDYQKQVDAQAAQLSAKYFDGFSQYSSRVAAFDLDSVKTLETEDLLIGDGELISDSTKFAAYYIGWNPKAKVFDQSINGTQLKSPFSITDGLANTGVIQGWKEGLIGMKIGGVRLVSVPSDKAYGETGQGDDIPPNTPIKFVVMAISMPEQIKQPEVSPELYQILGGS